MNTLTSTEIINFIELIRKIPRGEHNHSHDTNIQVSNNDIIISYENMRIFKLNYDYNSKYMSNNTCVYQHDSFNITIIDKNKLIEIRKIFSTAKLYNPNNDLFEFIMALNDEELIPFSVYIYMIENNISLINLSGNSISSNYLNTIKKYIIDLVNQQ